MPYFRPWLTERLNDRLVWTFRVLANGPEFCEIPGPGIDAPRAWVDAVVAVAHDLRYLRHGREIDPDSLTWEISIGADYDVGIGFSWRSTSGIGGFSGNGMSMDAAFCDAAVWVADLTQTELAGYEFVQWPSHGHNLLRPRRVDGQPVWADPRTNHAVCAIGELRREVNW
ncbi:hypothetical protein ACFWUP_12865 [Nocardia sp. NPDC058658]|uniref:hypothetical protein n=1 Tax=Nocardia sp. NPDC058658 TaxID=3346580 RepID=UPI00364A8EF3